MTKQSWWLWEHSLDTPFALYIICPIRYRTYDVVTIIVLATVVLAKKLEQWRLLHILRTYNKFILEYRQCYRYCNYETNSENSRIKMKNVAISLNLGVAWTLWKVFKATRANMIKRNLAKNYLCQSKNDLCTKKYFRKNQNCSEHYFRLL